MPEQLFLNIFSVESVLTSALLYRIEQTEPETKNRTTKYRLAANIAKRVTKTDTPIFSVGDEIYATASIEKQHEEKIDLDGTPVTFLVTLSEPEQIDLSEVQQGPERLVNKLVDWYYHAILPNSFHMENANYVGENIFAKLEARLYAAFKINVNEGLLRATRRFSGRTYLLLDPDYRVTWEQSLWDDVKYFAKSNLNADVYLPSQNTISAINERYGRVGSKPGRFVLGRNKVGEYEVLEFDFSKTPLTPGIVNGMSQLEFFTRVHNQGDLIKDKKQPLVKVRVSRGYHYGKENYHVPELLEFDKIPPHIRENKRVNAALANLLKPLPRGRFAQLLGFVQGDPFGKTKGFAGNDFVTKFVRIADKPLLVEGEVLAPFRVKMGDLTFAASSDTDFLKNVFKGKFHRGVEVKSLWLVYDASREPDVLTLYKRLREESIVHALLLPQEPVRKPISDPQYSKFLTALEGSSEADIVLTFGSSSDDELYETVKHQLIIRHGTPSQHISYEKTVDVLRDYESQGNETGTKAVLTLLSMQICAKLGGAPWSFEEPIYEPNCPILGLEIYHSPSRADFVVAACAVFDQFGEYLFSEPSPAEPTEIVAGLSAIIQSALSRYSIKCGKPNSVFIIREGLNYTQENAFLSTEGKGEIGILNEVLKRAGVQSYVFVMEKKGTHLRLFKRLTDVRVDNPSQGTVIVGQPFDKNELLMVSQESHVGTTVPVLYRVIRPDEPDMKKVSAALYKLTRHHWNTTRAIRTPAPAVHAHEIAYMVRRILKQTPRHRRILDTPFYL
jgi:Piwi domain